jgi:hypothetical protein
VWSVYLEGHSHQAKPGVGPCVSLFFFNRHWFAVTVTNPGCAKRATAAYLVVYPSHHDHYCRIYFCCCLFQQHLLYGTREEPCTLTQGAPVRPHWFLQFGKRTQNSRVAAWCKTESPAPLGIWSLLGPVSNPVLEHRVPVFPVLLPTRLATP